VAKVRELLFDLFFDDSTDNALNPLLELIMCTARWVKGKLPLLLIGALPTFSMIIRKDGTHKIWLDSS
jgi:hypothetical protein